MSCFLVCERECDQCLFGPNRIVSGARMRDILKSTQRNDTHFVCHKSTIAGREVACRGWYDRFSSNFARVAGRLGALHFVDPETGVATSARRTQAAVPLPDQDVA